MNMRPSEEGHGIRLWGNVGRGRFHGTLSYTIRKQRNIHTFEPLTKKAIVFSFLILIKRRRFLHSNGYKYQLNTSLLRAIRICERCAGSHDQFITSGEHKWAVSGLTMLLPHGYEGADRA